jgi:hypothetical protein
VATHDSMNEKQQAHDLIERLVPSQISAVVHLLEVMTDPVAYSLANAPVDDEPVSEEEAREIAAARASLDRGEGIPHEKVLAEFGLTLEDFERMGRTPLDPHETKR